MEHFLNNLEHTDKTNFMHVLTVCQTVLEGNSIQSSVTVIYPVFYSIRL